MRTVGQYPGVKPELQRALNTLERNVVEETDKLELVKINTYQSVSVLANYQAKIYDLILANTTGSAVTISLPSAGTWRGCRVGICQIAGTNTLTVQAVGSLINGLASVPIAGAQLREFVSDGTNWHSVGSNSPISGGAGVGDDGKVAYAFGGDIVFANQVKTDGTYLAIGANPASAGALRLANNSGVIRWRNAANDGDGPTIFVDSSNFLVFDAYTGSSGGIFFSTKVGTQYEYRINNATELTLTSTLANFQNNEVRTTGIVSAGTGSAAAPSHTITGQTDQGMYSIDASTTGMSAAGREAARFYTSASARILALGYNASTDSVSFTMGGGRTGNGDAYIDFSAHLAGPDDLRILRVAGVNGATEIIHNGTGALYLWTNNAAAIVLRTNNTDRWYCHSAGTLYPAADASTDLGIGVGGRIRDGFFSSSVTVGTNPATTGGVRLANNTSVAWRNAANSADLEALALASNTLRVGSGFASIDIGIAATNIAIGLSGTEVDLASALVANTGGSGNLVDIRNAATHGTTPATAGVLRLSNNDSVAWRNVANTADIQIFLNSSDLLLIGNSTACVTVRSSASTNIQTVIGANTEQDISAGLIDCQDNEIRTTGFAAIGTTPATTGTIRLPNAGTVVFRNNANSANLQFASLSTNTLRLGNDFGTIDIGAVGSTTHVNVGGGTTEIDLASSLTCNVGGSTNLVDIINAITIGANPATAGEIRFANTKKIVWRNAANGANLEGLQITSGNVVFVGDTNATGLKLAAGSVRLEITSTGIGLNGAAPWARTTYTVTNPTTDRALNVTGDTLAQGLQVLGTLIADLQARGDIL